MLTNKGLLRDAFFEGDKFKPVQCIRVDGATDEGPSHSEVCFLMTEIHHKTKGHATFVTTRYSGGSYLNKVELQNGCLTRAHANMFIPSTLSGDPYGSEYGSLNQEAYNENMDLATEVYIHRCNQTPFGTTVINSFKGASSEKAQKLTSRRKKLLQFLARRTSPCMLRKTDSDL